MEHVSLKPNRDILNPKFDSYHLGAEPLELKSLNLLQPVAYYPLTDEHYSYSYLRAHASQNLLTLDFWNENENALFFVDSTFSVMGLTFNQEDGTFASPVKMCTFPTPPAEKVKEHTCPSVSFPSSETCLLNDGTGQLYLVKTGRRDDKLEKQNWICSLPTAVCDMSFPFYVCTASSDIEEKIHCTILSLKEDNPSTTGHPNVVLHCLQLLQNNKESPSAGDQFVVSKKTELTGSSVPIYISHSPDFSDLVIASQGKFQIVSDKDEVNPSNGISTEGSAKDSSNAAKNNVAASSTVVVNEVEKQSSAYTGEQIEECDMETEENLELFVISKEDGTVKLQTQVSGHQWLFSVCHSPAEPTYFCVRHDVDGVLWKPVAAENQARVSWKHVTTFNALGYIQASKKNHKYTACSQTFGFVAIVDCVRNIYIYVTNSVSSLNGTQYVLELPTSDEILGAQASSDTLFVLTRASVFAVKVL